jgi:hypothetical protein
LKKKKVSNSVYFLCRVNNILIPLRVGNGKYAYETDSVFTGRGVVTKIRNGNFSGKELSNNKKCLSLQPLR